MLSFKPAFSLSSFTFIKRIFSSLLSTIRMVSSAYLRLLIFLPAILIPACASSSPAFHMIYSVYKLNKQGDNIQPWHTPFPIWNQSVSHVLTVASWPAYRFFHEAGDVVWYSHFLKNFPQFIAIYIIRGFGVVNKAEVDAFLELSCFFNDPMDVGNLISGFSAFSKSSLNIWKFVGWGKKSVLNTFYYPFLSTSFINFNAYQTSFEFYLLSNHCLFPFFFHWNHLPDSKTTC